MLRFDENAQEHGVRHLRPTDRLDTPARQHIIYERNLRQRLQVLSETLPFLRGETQ